MVRGLDVLSTCVKAESGIGDDVDVVLELPLDTEAGGLDSAVFVKLVVDRSAPEPLGPRTGVWVERDRLDCCAVTPLVDEAAKVDTGVVAPLEAVRPKGTELELEAI
jgi:hypothetical protein